MRRQAVKTQLAKREGLDLPGDASSLVKPDRIVLVRHGQPAIALSPRTSHAGFSDYIDAYEEAGLDPASLPPQELRELVKELDSIFTSGRPRSHQSAAALAPHAALEADPLFVEAPLASPRIPLLAMSVPKWAVVSRIARGFSVAHGGGVAPARAVFIAPGLRERPPALRSLRQFYGPSAPSCMECDGDESADRPIALVGESDDLAERALRYFSWMMGRQLRARGFVRTGSHQARYWNTVTYESRT